MPAVRLSFFAFTNFRFEGFWVSVQTCLLKHIFTLNDLSDNAGSQKPQTEPPTHLDGLETFSFMFQIVEAVVAVAVVAELPVSEAVAVSEGQSDT